MSNYAYERYKNLEALFNWLDSCDQDAATNANLTESLTIQTPIAYSGEGEHSDPVVGYAKADIYDSTETYYTFANDQYSVTDDFAVDDNGYITGFKQGVTYYTQKVLHYTTTFTKDSAGYRLEKFRREFNQHLNKEYCLVYFIMTELLLCYDSRGKNMMLASFGPQQVGGDFIWFPIFYDIDTQLGLNNSGAYLWDYDADVTKDGLFSTPTSVLWVNLWDAFREDIMSQYRVLRGLDDKTNVVGSLSYENIAGAYTCDANVFDSYAMRGVRPIIAIGLDEYYKYFATTTASGVGWFTQTGDYQKDATADYAYACQGDKILTTELLVRNRLNYIDSWWQGGDYHINKVKGSQLQCRVSGNRKTLTSDKYLEVNPAPEGFTYAQYPKAYFDAQPGFQLKPFLKQYISFFTDEVAGEVIKYTGDEGQENGLRTPVPAATITAYKTTPETPNEQLNYIPGIDYLSSLGDLSTSYISEFTINRGKRLLDITLGSDIPGYKNEMIKSNTIFNLHCGRDDDGKKPLLQKMILTGLTNLDKTIDISGSAKLQEFRALNTNIPNVYFAEGAPIHTIHLPASIKSITISQDKELTNILETRPVVKTLNSEGVAVDADPASYRGLYVEGLTDSTSASAGADHSVSSLSINGGGMGYSSYKLLDKLVNIKTGTSSKVNIGLIDVEWTPYTKVEFGEPYDATKSNRYYTLNDHGTYSKYTYSSSTWTTNTLNGVLYLVDSSKPRQTITNLDLLDRFISEYETAKRLGNQTQFQQLELTGEASLPTITGNLYVDNSSSSSMSIEENDLTSVYKVYFPNLNITAASINKANMIKYVRVEDNNKVEVLDIERTNNASTKLHPQCSIPTKTYHDFLGWSEENPNTTDNPTIALSWDNTNRVYQETEAWNNLTYKSENDLIITLYAVFTPHVYQMTFKYGDGTIIDTIGTAFGSQGINLPSVIPYQDESELPEDQKYGFLGYAYNADAITPLDMSKISASRDMTFYAIFEESSVYENPLSDEYLVFTGPSAIRVNSNGNEVQGYTIGLNNRYAYKGKITLPTTHNNLPVLAIMDGSASNDGPAANGISNDNHGQNQITHIFWDRSDGGQCQLKKVGQAAFYNTTIKYVELPDDLYDIRGAAFALSYCTNYEDVHAKRIEDTAFNGSKNNLTTVHIAGSVEYIGSGSFAWMENVTEIEIGGPGDPSQISSFGVQPFSSSKLQRVTVYTSNTSDAVW